MKIGQLKTTEPIEKAMREIRYWLGKINADGLNTNTNYDAKTNIALLRMHYKGKSYEFRSQNQKNCRLNMWAIARVMEYKVRAHLMGIEQFDKSMQAYLQLGASAEAMMAGAQATGTESSQNLSVYAVIGISPLASNDELKAHYKKLAKSWHPDMAGSEEAKTVFEKKFAEINEAWRQIQLERGLVLETQE